MSVEITRQEKSGTRKFEKELVWVIQQLLKRGLEPTHDRIFDFCRTHPADLPLISRLRTIGYEDHLRVYLHLWGRVRERMKATIPTENKVIDPNTGRTFE